MPELTHWKKLNNPNYLGAYSLQPGEEPVYTIKSVGLEMVIGTDGKKEQCTVAHFLEEDVKPMILNVTSCKTIAKLCDTPYVEQWAGRKIQVYATKVKAFGEEVEALRVRTKVPAKQKPIMDEKYPGWAPALEAIKNGETSIEFLQGKYAIPPKCLKVMQEAANA